MAIAECMPRDWFKLFVEVGYIPSKTDDPLFELTYMPLKPTPELVALVIGDTVHNLRSALDHLASGIIRVREPGAKRYFPVNKERKNLKTSGDLASLETALPGSEDLILNKIRPINDTRDHLWAFGSIDIEDKHNLVTPTLTVANITGVNLIGNGSYWKNMVLGNDAARPFVPIILSQPFTVQGDPKLSVDITFGPGTPFHGMPVISTLLDIRQLIAETLNAFEALIAR